MGIYHTPHIQWESLGIYESIFNWLVFALVNIVAEGTSVNNVTKDPYNPYSLISQVLMASLDFKKLQLIFIIF